MEMYPKKFILNSNDREVKGGGYMINDISDISDIRFINYRGGLSCLNHFLRKKKF